MNRPPASALRTARLGRCLALLLGAFLPGLAQENIEVTGLGFFKNRNLDARLAFLQGFDPGVTVPLDSVVLEDSAFLLLQQVKREGYLEPSITGRFRTGAETETATWSGDYAIQLPVDFEARRATYEIRPGPLFYYKNVSIEGVPFMEDDEPKRFFVPGGFVLRSRSGRVYTPENFERRTGRLLAALEALGYRSAEVVRQDVAIDSKTGAVEAAMEIEPGPLHLPGRLSFVDANGQTLADFSVPEEMRDRALTREWERALRLDPDLETVKKKLEKPQP